MGSKGSKPRKPHDHLPKVGSPKEVAWERETRKREVFGSLPIWLVLGFLVLVLVGLLAITL
jgi:hypothetical protein